MKGKQMFLFICFSVLVGCEKSTKTSGGHGLKLYMDFLKFTQRKTESAWLFAGESVMEYLFGFDDRES